MTVLAFPDPRQHFLKPSVFLDSASYLLSTLLDHLRSLSAQLVYQGTCSPDAAMDVKMLPAGNELAYRVEFTWDEAAESAPKRVVTLGVANGPAHMELRLELAYELFERAASEAPQHAQRVTVSTLISSRSHRQELAIQLACAFVQFLSSGEVRLLEETKDAIESVQQTFKDFSD